ncbi:MAG: HprK-related kinase B [Planctomycetes bacterium]|nr:HprK-related kinase B [Planctomycetota bacterium]
MPDLEALATELEKANEPKFQLGLQVDAWRVRVDSNSEELITHLKRYFQPFVKEISNPDTHVVAIECDEPDWGIDYTDWEREGGKVGRKDAFADIKGGRAIWKVRTGMQFLLGETTRLAAGRCLKNDNQVINFIITQYITWLLEHDYALCHAAGVEWHGKGLMFAGFSGGGKSTLSLHLMSKGAKYTSGDRVLIKAHDGKVRMCGVPKLPRINPGTALNNPDLAKIVPETRKAELAKLSRDELWKLEEKYDVFIDECFGDGRFAMSADVDALFVLNWHRNSTDPTELHQVNLFEREDLLAAVMKSPGPFWMPVDGQAPAKKPAVDPEWYYPHVKQMRVYEVTGKADFDAATAKIEALLQEL